jgi:hypothetical protein
MDMKHLIKAGRAFYGIGIAGLGLQQFIYAAIRPVIAPAWPSWIHASVVWAYLLGAGLLAAGIIIMFSNHAKKAALILGSALLFLFIALHVPFQLFIIPYSFHLGLWTDGLKELALSGGAFVMAGSYAANQLDDENKKLIRLGSIFFSITMISFGIDHFLYTETVNNLVPAWIPGHLFWTYFAAVALIGSGVAIICRIWLQTVALLLGLMLFLWFIILHIPRAIAQPGIGKGNEITSVFEALAFSGIAFVIACTLKKKSGQG